MKTIAPKLTEHEVLAVLCDEKSRRMAGAKSNGSLVASTMERMKLRAMMLQITDTELANEVARIAAKYRQAA
ncbi:hypothetical protein A3J34_02105 [Candidatus Peribacteria bacterium RIFCSPLOWO2_02_FULL_51_10]|nr:MAG: hypothetical protein A3J34_02105 [Candidatus Peribacteria bacterium RIFCSPLOWO2_02_FULL_51_10]